jgi:uncharacterized protein (TIGR02594 family)
LSALPKQYAWLAKENGPKVIVEALKLYGTKELSGDANNKVIMGWAKELGLEKTYYADAVPWCGLFVGVVVKRAGYVPVDNPLWARNWTAFGTPASVPSFGDILVFSRNGGGHVGFYVGEDDTTYHVLGGNQSDQVNISRISKLRLLDARRCPWKIGKPTNVRRRLLAATGEISVNEE